MAFSMLKTGSHVHASIISLEKKKKKTKNLMDFMAEPCTEGIMLTEEQLNLKELV